MNYNKHWDLSTIPETDWASENGRRSRSKGPSKPNVKLKPCKKCATPLSARERRKPCPECGTRDDDRSVNSK